MKTKTTTTTAATKQYIVVNEEDIPTTKLIKLSKTKGVFIECPCCEKLVRIKNYG